MAHTDRYTDVYRTGKTSSNWRKARKASKRAGNKAIRREWAAKSYSVRDTVFNQ